MVFRVIFLIFVLGLGGSNYPLKGEALALAPFSSSAILNTSAMQEIFKPIKGYEGLYEVSNLGNVKSLARKIYKGKFYYISKEMLLKPGTTKKGYNHVALRKDNKAKSHYIHHLVWENFYNKSRVNGLVIDHIDGNKVNNRFNNLRQITNRENISGTSKNMYSDYVGVTFSKALNKFQSGIQIDNRHYHLGYFDNEIDASNAYQDKLKEVNYG